MARAFGQGMSIRYEISPCPLCGAEEARTISDADEIRTELVGWDSTHGPLVGEPPADLPEVELRVGVRAEDREPVERFTREIGILRRAHSLEDLRQPAVPA